ncbi:hypothetical protein ACOSQ2_016799 [Xanthoceras sorbifolium]
MTVSLAIVSHFSKKAYLTKEVSSFVTSTATRCSSSSNFTSFSHSTFFFFNSSNFLLLSSFFSKVGLGSKAIQEQKSRTGRPATSGPHFAGRSAASSFELKPWPSHDAWPIPHQQRGSLA